MQNMVTNGGINASIAPVTSTRRLDRLRPLLKIRPRTTSLLKCQLSFFPTVLWQTQLMLIRLWLSTARALLVVSQLSMRFLKSTALKAYSATLVILMVWAVVEFTCKRTNIMILLLLRTTLTHLLNSSFGLSVTFAKKRELTLQIRWHPRKNDQN